MAQYTHDFWGSEQGFPGAAVFAIAQSGDGYMWFGTERGLVRFDGFEFTLVDVPQKGHAPLGAVRGLVCDRHGDMWIRLDGSRLMRYHAGTFENVLERYSMSEVVFTSMTLGRDGEVLLWGPRNSTVRFRNGGFERLSPRERTDGIVVSELEAADGTVWLGTRDQGLYHFGPDGLLSSNPDSSTNSVNALASAEDGGILLGTDNGMMLWKNGQLERVPLMVGHGSAPVQVRALTKDREQNLWVATDHGLLRRDRAGQVTSVSFPAGDAAEVSAVYEDHDGDIWFAGPSGVERLRDGMFTSFRFADLHIQGHGGPIFVDAEGRTWFAPASGGLYTMQNGKVARVSVDGLDHDVVYSMSGGGGEVWLGRQQGGLTELVRRGDAWEAKSWLERDGLPQNSVYTVHRAKDGSVWAGTVSAGLALLRNGKVTTYSVANGLDSNAVFSATEGADGTMWFTSPNGLVCFRDGVFRTYVAGTEPLSPNVRTAFEDREHTLWVGTSRGIGWFSNGRVNVPTTLPLPLNEAVIGIAQDERGFLWIATTEHILRVNRERLLSGSLSDAEVASFGSTDGLSEVEGVRRDRSVVSDAHGHVWLSLANSIAVADVESAVGYIGPTGVRIESIASSGPPLPMGGLLTLPSGTHSLTIRYSGTNMAVPQRTRFRYRLDGSDQGWSSDTSLREVVYTNLTAGSYVLRIMASNGLGEWTGEETTLHVRIQPAFWQTWYFRLFAVMVVFAAAAGLHRLRTTQLTERLNIRFRDRLAERTRIAQDLHDTLLQGVLSASMQLNLAHDRIPDEVAAKPMLSRVLHLMRQVSDEGRRAVCGLRAPETTVRLEEAFSTLAFDLHADESLVYRVFVQGETLPVVSVARDEIFRIGREAVVNAFRHAMAHNVTVELEYARRSFRMVIRDDGSGIEPVVLKHGRDGHWGLAGMRERASSIGSELRICSRVGEGTAVYLTVPGSVAYADRGRRRWKTSWQRLQSLFHDRESTEETL
ncbi:Two component regulator propeller [Bryocella elongata]|uniref:Two component regulator propeller n=1 Tax=Bryocella elongata TaxID=863522 RepID=A0A1H5SNI2_9BACT|nr:sensor histidine kinase [Bryocella elongata]SEF52173.1 Two component regulator propeller [Bryocella elongata]